MDEGLAARAVREHRQPVRLGLGLIAALLLPFCLLHARASESAGVQAARSIGARAQQDVPPLSLLLHGHVLETRAEADVEVHVRLLRDGRQQAQGRQHADAAGKVTLGLDPLAGGALPRIAPGDLLEIQVGQDAPYRIEVPQLAADLSADGQRLVGRAPPGATVSAIQHRERKWYLSKSLGELQAGADGGFELLLPEPGAYIQGLVTYRTDEGHSFRAGFASRRIEVLVGASELSGSASLGADIELQDEDPQGRRGSLQVRMPQTRSSFEWREALDGGLALQAGTRLSATVHSAMGRRGTMTATVPAMWMRLDGPSRRLEGQGPSDASLQVTLQPWKGDPITTTVRTDASGAFRLADLALDVERGMVVEVAFEGEDGFRFLARDVIESYTISVHGTFIEALTRWPNREVSVRLLGPGGDEKGARRLTASKTGYVGFRFQMASDHRVAEPTRIEPGDTLILDAEGGDPLIFHIPELVLHVDLEADRLHGVASPGAGLRGSVLREVGTVWQTGQAEADGRFELRFGALIDLQRPSSGVLEVFTGSGTRYLLDWAVMGLVIELERAVRVEGPSGRDVELWLHDRAGQRLAHTSSAFEPRYGSSGPPTSLLHAMLRDRSGATVLPQPGDRLTVESAGDRIELIVPRLEGEIDLDADLVWGRTEPGQRIEVSVQGRNGLGHPERSAYSFVTAGEDGRFSVDFSQDTDVRINDVGRLYLDLPEGHQVFRGLNTTGLLIDLDRSTVSGAVSVLVFPEGSEILVQHEDGAGRLWQSPARVGVRGAVKAVLRDEAGGLRALEAGDRIALLGPAEGGAPGELIFETRVPDFTMQVDRDEEAVLGEAPHPGEVFVFAEAMLTRERSNSLGSSGYRGTDVREDGSYRIPFSRLTQAEFDFRPGQSFYATLTLPDGVKARRWFILPIVNVQLGGAQVCGYAMPGAAVEAELLSGDDIGARASGRAGADASFLLRLRDERGEDAVTGSPARLRVRVGDETQELRLPRFEAQADWTYRGPQRAVTMTRITGSAPVNTSLIARVYEQSCLPLGGEPVYDQYPFGSGSFDLGSIPALARGIGLTLGHYAAPLQHRQYRMLVRPLVRAYLGTGRVEGRLSPGTRARLWLRDEAGDRIASVWVTGDTYGRFEAELRDASGAALRLSVGQRLELEAGSDRSQLQLRPLDFDFDPRAGLFVTAPPGFEIRAAFLEDATGTPRVVEGVADAHGAYRLRADDLSPRADWRMEDTRIAYVTARSRDGHEIARAGSGVGLGRDERRAYLPLVLAGR